MNLTSILEADIFTTAYQRERCRHRLGELRVARGRAMERLQELCRRVQSNPALHEPEKMSHAVAELKYLNHRTEQLEKILQLAGGPQAEESDEG